MQLPEPFLQRLTQGRGRGRDTKPGTPAYMKVMAIAIEHYPGPNKQANFE
nr:hypothetical protein [Candidatus Hamiltonella defensa]